jgi:hypothetical protein
LTRRQPRLLADDTIAAHFFDGPAPVGDLRSCALRPLSFEIVIVYANT